MIRDQINLNAKDKDGFSIDMIDNKNTQNLNFRKHFIFNYDEDLDKMETRDHNALMNQQEAKKSSEDQ